MKHGGEIRHSQIAGLHDHYTLYPYKNGPQNKSVHSVFPSALCGCQQHVSPLSILYPRCKDILSTTAYEISSGASQKETTDL